MCGYQNGSEKGFDLRFDRLFPAVALAFTTSSAIPALAYAASPPKAAPHSTATAKTRRDPPPRTKAVSTRKTQRGSSKSREGSVRSAASTVAEGTTSTMLGTAPSPRKLAVLMLLAAINKGRTAHGLPALALDPQQSKCSRSHSKDMAREGQISHDQFPADICVPHTYAAENVGEAPRGSASAAVLELHRLMMDEGPCETSACTGAAYEQHGHYMNLLNPRYKHVGIGIVVKNGATWLTEDFTS